MMLMVSHGLAWSPPGHNDTSEGRFLKRFDPEAHDGLGEAEWTPDRAAAMRFPDATAAMRLWNTQSQTRPLRGDGRPNKPLTAYTVQLIQEPTQ